MSDDVTETIEEPELATVLAFPGARPADEVESDEEAEAPEFHPILKVWREVLAPARKEGGKRVTPQWANRMVTAYTGLGFADMNRFRDIYYSKLEALYLLLLAEIEKDEDCLTYSSPEDDVANNSAHYKQLLFDWQLLFLDWEIEWDTEDPDAPIVLAAISEIHKLFFGPTGVTQFLDNIKFEFSESDQAELAVLFENLKTARGVGDE